MGDDWMFWAAVVGGALVVASLGYFVIQFNRRRKANQEKSKDIYPLW